uniref:Uncharacterized protein n=1 Tax=Lepeophtheirus salmonis TaxID=72036 RepID=A0A0K2T3Y1_LEPSM
MRSAVLKTRRADLNDFVISLYYKTK